MGGFELASGVKDEESLLLNYNEIFSDASYRDWPAEVSSPSSSLPWRQIRTLPINSVDSFMLARLISEHIAQKVPKLPLEVTDFIQKSVSADYRQRANPLKALTSESWIRSIRVVEISEKFDSLSVMEHEQREKFLLHVQSNVSVLSRDFISHKAIPSLASFFLMPTAMESLAGIKLFFTSAKNLLYSELPSTVVPVLAKLLAKPDRSVRMLLLESLPDILDSLDTKVVQETIYPQIVSGFTDALPALREATLKTSTLLAPKLTTRQINGELLRFYSRLQGDEQPGIRANATVCIGKVARLLEEATRLKVLGGAYVKALRDPFGPTRSAALAAIAATQDYLPREELARSILPNIIPLIIDTERLIRQSAIQASEQIMKQLVAYSATIPDVQRSPISDTPSRIKPEKPAIERSSWGISSLAEKFMALDDDSRSSKSTAPTGSIPAQRPGGDGWGVEDDDLLGPVNNASQALLDPANVAWKDEENPWSQETTDSALHTIRPSPLVRTTVTKTSSGASKPMTLGRPKTKLSDNL